LDGAEILAITPLSIGGAASLPLRPIKNQPCMLRIQTHVASRYVYIYIYIQINMSVWKYTYVYIIEIHIYIYVFTPATYIYIYIYIYIYVPIKNQPCILRIQTHVASRYVYIYIYIYIYICTYQKSTMYSKNTNTSCF
jgi:hypothetical protein